MLPFSLPALALLATLLSPAVAQTFTKCNPLNTTCPADPALGMSFTWNLTNSTFDSTSWNVTDESVDYSNNVGSFIVNQKGDAPTVQSNFFIFWGSNSVIAKAALGQGIVSSITLLSDDLDEIDWEWIGGNNTHVQTNYFGKGITGDYDRSLWVPVNNPQEVWHNYTTSWNTDQLQWLIDGNVVRTLVRSAADGNGTQYPQTPMHCSIGIWAGGDSTSPGTVQWAGGKVDYSKAPFTFEVSAVHITDGTLNATSYSYGDKTGDSTSVTVAEQGKSVVATTLTQPPAESISQKFNGLSEAAKIAIYASVGAVALGLLTLCCCFCFRQRKRGRHTRSMEDAAWNQSNAELMAYRSKMSQGGFAQGSASPGGIAQSESFPLADHYPERNKF